MRLITRGKVWYVETYYYESRGKKRVRVRRSTGIRADGRESRRAAESIARAQIADIACSGGQKEKSITLSDAIIHLGISLGRAGRAAATIEIVDQKAKQLYRLLGGGTLLSAITLAHLEQYADTRLEDGAHRGTIHRELRTLRQAWHTAHRSGLVDSGPPAMPNLGTVYTPRERWLPHDEVIALLAELPAHWQEQVIMYLHLGLRASELYQITPADVDFDTGEVRVRGTKTAGADRILPLTPEVRAILLRARERDPMFRRWTNRDHALVNACERAGIERCCVTDLRRTCATELARRGVPIHIAMRLLGHSNPKMLLRVYAQVASEDRRAAAEKLPEYQPVLHNINTQPETKTK